ncbi:MAG: hypothetical protein LBS19_07775 [Clostridiales bacterium]|jgi:hypothetical protein|nr:hypothetical protein [Clostridiales bacterium]
MTANNERFSRPEVTKTDFDPPLIKETYNIPEEVKKNYQARYYSIIHAPLRPETIETYAGDALNKYVDLLEDAHKEIGIGIDDYSIETEKSVASNFLGLENPWKVQEHIKTVQKDIDKIINRVSSSKAGHSSSYYVPPSREESTAITASDGSFEEAEVTPRTATVLFLLEHDFGVNIGDPKELTMESGALPDNAMRKEPYIKIEVEPLKRLILVCDQKGNRTYVFDTSRFEELGLNSEQIAGMDKPGLDLLLKQHDKLGASLNYSSRFIDNVSELIRKPAKPLKEQNDKSKSHSYLELLPEKPDDYEFSLDLAAKLGVSETTLRGWLTSGKLGGEAQKYRRHGSARGLIYAFSPEQQKEAARLNGEKSGLAEKPEGYEFSTDFLRSYRLAESSLRNWIKSGKLGEMQRFRRPDSHLGHGYALSPEQQEIIIGLKDGVKTKSTDENIETLPEKPDDYEFIIDVVKRLGIPERTLRRWLISGKLGGEAREFFNKNSTTGKSFALSYEQQREAQNLYKGHERLTGLYDKPEDYEFTADFIIASGVERKTLDDWLKSGKLGGEAQKFLNKKSPLGYSYALSPEQRSAALRLLVNKSANPLKP